MSKSESKVMSKLTLTNEEAAYIAGIIDGEGCIHLTKTKPKPHSKTRIYQLKVSITNTNEALINWLYSKIGGYLYKAKKNYSPKSNPNARIHWSITVSTIEAYSLLKTIRPYLIGKAEQADVGIEFQEHIQDCKHRGYTRKGLQKGRPVLSDEIIDYREKLHARITELKKSDTYLLLSAT